MLFKTLFDFRMVLRSFFCTEEENQRQIENEGVTHIDALAEQPLLFFTQAYNSRTFRVQLDT